MLPPAKALEREMVSLGVSAKQADRARQALERSAQRAGFYAQGKDRLVLPAFPGTLKVDPPPAVDRKDLHARGSGNGGGADDLPPFISGLLQKLPPADSEWSLADRVKWLQAAAHIFGLMYTSNDRGEITVSVLERS